MTYSSSSAYHIGGLEVICGPMFSGKTEELIRRIRRAQIARQKVQIFKPTIDDRYNRFQVVSHSAQSVDAVPLLRSYEILQKLYDTTRWVAIDEAQFFDEDIIQVVKKLTRRGLRVVVAGLDLDYRGRPFGPMPVLLAMADVVTKIHAICTVCGAPATKTQRIHVPSGKADDEQVVVGEADLYEARCGHHHEDGEDLEDYLPLQHEFSFVNSGKEL